MGWAYAAWGLDCSLRGGRARGAGRRWGPVPVTMVTAGQQVSGVPREVMDPLAAAAGGRGCGHP